MEEQKKVVIAGIIFVLLMLHFGKLDRTLIIMMSLPFGLVGGLWAVYLAGYNMSVAVGVGFIGALIVIQPSYAVFGPVSGQAFDPALLQQGFGQG